MDTHPSTPEAVYDLYMRDVAQHGKPGAYARVGRQLGRSDETVRRWVHQQEATQRADPLAYVPPPGGYPEPQPAPQPTPEPPQTATDATPVMAAVNVDEMPQETPQELPHATRGPMVAPVVRIVRVPQRPVRWWSMIALHPQVAAIVVAIVLVWFAFPH